MAFSSHASQQQQKQQLLAVKTKGPKGGAKPPIYDVAEHERLFTADEFGILTQDVKCFSFYHFARVQDPEAAATKLAQDLGAQALRVFAGTVYIAQEGLNAQFSVATAKQPQFEVALRTACSEVLGLGPGEQLDINWGAALSAGTPAPFKRFRVVARPQILTDGLAGVASPEGAIEGVPAAFDWSDAGEELDPAEWHAQLAGSGSNAVPNDEASGVGSGGRDPSLLLDCRNDYESDVGKFAGAMPLGTTVFSESWPALDAVVATLKSKDEPVYTYCTGQS